MKFFLTNKFLVSALILVGITFSPAMARPKENLKASTGRKSFSLIGISVGQPGTLSQLSSAKLSDKYDLNSISTSNIKVDLKDSALTTEIVQKYLNQNKVGWKILLKMTEADKGEINIKKLLERASYGVSQQNYAIIAGLMGDPKTSFNGDVQRFVYPLFNNIYVMVYLNTLNTFQVYKLNNDKNRLIEALKVGIKNRFLTAINTPLRFDLVADSRTMKTNKVEDAFLTTSGVFNEDVLMTFTKLEKKVNEFQVSTKLYGDKVLYARIGKKENVYPTQRFFAFEQIGDTTFRRVGIIRAKKVADNKTNLIQNGGKRADTTTFNVVYGKKVKPGKLGSVSIVSRPDLGVGIMMGYDIGATRGFAPRISINVATLAGALGQQLPEIANVKFYGSFVPLGVETDLDYTYTLSTVSYGIGKEFRIGKIGFVEAYAGYHNPTLTSSYYDVDEKKTLTESLSYTGYEGGLILGKNIGPLIQIFGKAQLQVNDQIWDDADFVKESSGLTFGFGLKFDF
jgi:hypothetical protein